MSSYKLTHSLLALKAPIFNNGPESDAVLQFDKG